MRAWPLRILFERRLNFRSAFSTGGCVGAMRTPPLNTEKSRRSFLCPYERPLASTPVESSPQSPAARPRPPRDRSSSQRSSPGRLRLASRRRRGPVPSTPRAHRKLVPARPKKPHAEVSLPAARGGPVVVHRVYDRQERVCPRSACIRANAPRAATQDLERAAMRRARYAPRASAAPS